MLVSDVLRRVRAQVGDEAGTFVDTDDVIDQINDAAIELNMEFEFLTASTPVVTAAGTASYNLPVDFLAPKRMSFGIGTALQWLEQASRNEIEAEYPAWADTTSNRGTPTRYWVEGLTYGFQPTPDGVYGGTLFYVQTPVLIAAVGDTCPLPAWVHPLYARMSAAMMKERDEDNEAAQIIRQEVYTKINAMRHRIQVNNTGPTRIRDDWVNEY